MAEDPQPVTDRVVVIDDDVQLCSMLREYLSRHGWQVVVAHTGASGIEAVRDTAVDLVVLDVMLPDFDGFEVLRRLQREADVHVLLLTARGEEVDRIVGLELGADDYLPKPFNPRELLARMRAVVRRSQSGTRAAATAEKHGPGFSVDTANRRICYGDDVLDLTDLEYLLLRIFLAHSGEVLTRDFLYEEALERRYRAYDRSLDMQISRLRKKLDSLAHFRGALIAVRSSGYLFSPLLPEGRRD